MNVRPKLKRRQATTRCRTPKVRQALNYATDKNAIIQITTHDVGKPMHSFMSSATPLHWSDGPLYPYDLAKAKAAAGGGRLRERLRDVKLTRAGRQRRRDRHRTALQQMWAQVGVKLSLEQVDNATRTDRYREGDFQMRLRPGPTTSPTRARSPPTSSTSRTSSRCTRAGRTSEADKLFEQSQQETDAAKRADAVQARSRQIYNESGPILYLYETPYPVALRKKVKGFVQIPLGNNIFAATSLEK